MPARRPNGAARYAYTEQWNGGDLPMREVEQLIHVLQEWDKGKIIEARYKWGNREVWGASALPTQWSFADFDYRVKPEPREWWIELHGLCKTVHRNNTASYGGELIHVREVLP